MKKHTPKLLLVASAVAVAGMFAIPMIGSADAAATNNAASMNDPARVVAKAGKKGGQGDDRSAAKGDNGKGDKGGGKKKHGGKKKK